MQLIVAPLSCRTFKITFLLAVPVILRMPTFLAQCIPAGNVVMRDCILSPSSVPTCNSSCDCFGRVAFRVASIMYTPGINHIEQTLVGILVVPGATFVVPTALFLTSPIGSKPDMPVFSKQMFYICCRAQKRAAG